MASRLDRGNENNIKWYTKTDKITVSLTAQNWINRVKKLYKEHPDDFEYLVENSDGSICAKMSNKYLKIAAPRKLSEEARQKNAARLVEMRKKKNQGTNFSISEKN